MAQVRAPMPPSKRAKIFSMFDAIKDLKEALVAKKRIPEERKILAADAIEELNRTLNLLEKGTNITMVYYCACEERYHQLTGPVCRIDSLQQFLQLGEICIYFEDIYEVLV